MVSLPNHFEFRASDLKQLNYVYITSTIVCVDQSHFESLYPDTARAEDLEKLAEFIKTGSSAQLLSLPGVGRGTIFGLLANSKKIRDKHFGEDNNSLHFVRVDFSEIRGRSLFDAMKFLFLSLSESLRERRNPANNKISDLFKESLKYKDELVLFQALKEAIDHLVLENGLQIVFLFDRFEEYIPSVTAQFFTNLRTLRNRAKYKFSVVFSLNRPLEQLLDGSILSDFYELIEDNHIFLGLRDDATTNFRISYIEKVTRKKVPAQTLEQIIKETGGVGKLVKLAAEAVLSNTDPNIKDIKKLLFENKLVQGALVEICRSLLPIEQQSLIKENFSDEGAVSYLEKIGLLKSNKIQVPLFEEHIKWHRQTAKQETEKIIFDANRNTIKLGEDILSDRLTGSEFRLLCFLLNNPDRIVDREEIINIVWSSVKSTAGITDQAIDQLIFRLRRKIEKDLSNPMHLQTVKGRGLKFIA